MECKESRGPHLLLLLLGVYRQKQGGTVEGEWAGFAPFSLSVREVCTKSQESGVPGETPSFRAARLRFIPDLPAGENAPMIR